MCIAFTATLYCDRAVFHRSQPPELLKLSVRLCIIFLLHLYIQNQSDLFKFIAICHSALGYGLLCICIQVSLSTQYHLQDPPTSRAGFIISNAIILFYLY